VRGWARCTCVLHTYSYTNTIIQKSIPRNERTHDHLTPKSDVCAECACRAREHAAHPCRIQKLLHTACLQYTQHTVFAAGLRAFRQQLRQCHATRSVAPCVTKKRSQPGAIVEDVICNGVVNAQHTSPPCESGGVERGGESGENI